MSLLTKRVPEIPYFKILYLVIYFILLNLNLELKLYGKDRKRGMGTGLRKWVEQKFYMTVKKNRKELRIENRKKNVGTKER